MDRIDDSVQCESGKVKELERKVAAGAGRESVLRGKMRLWAGLALAMFGVAGFENWRADQMRGTALDCLHSLIHHESGASAPPAMTLAIAPQVSGPVLQVSSLDAYTWTAWPKSPMFDSPVCHVEAHEGDTASMCNVEGTDDEFTVTVYLGHRTRHLFDVKWKYLPVVGAGVAVACGRPEMSEYDADFNRKSISPNLTTTSDENGFKMELRDKPAKIGTRAMFHCRRLVVP